MAEGNTEYEGIKGEDYIDLTPEANAVTITPWDLRLVNTTGRSLHIDFRHTSLMVKMLVISNAKEKNNESARREEKLAERTGVEF